MPFAVSRLRDEVTEPSDITPCTLRTMLSMDLLGNRGRRVGRQTAMRESPVSMVDQYSVVDEATKAKDVTLGSAVVMRAMTYD